MEELKHNVTNAKYVLHKSLHGTIYANIIQSCLRINPKRRAEVKELLQAFKIIYSIYEKYSDEKEAERVLMEETSKIKTVHSEKQDGFDSDSSKSTIKSRKVAGGGSSSS